MPCIERRAPDRNRRQVFSQGRHTHFAAAVNIEAGTKGHLSLDESCRSLSEGSSLLKPAGWRQTSLATVLAGRESASPWPMKILVDSVLGDEPPPSSSAWSASGRQTANDAPGRGRRRPRDRARFQPAERAHDLLEHENRNGDDARFQERSVPAGAAPVDGVPRSAPIGDGDLHHQFDGRLGDEPRHDHPATCPKRADAGRHVLDFVSAQSNPRAPVAYGRPIPLLLRRLLHDAHPPTARDRERDGRGNPLNHSRSDVDVAGHRGVRPRRPRARAIPGPGAASAGCASQHHIKANHLLAGGQYDDGPRNRDGAWIRRLSGVAEPADRRRAARRGDLHRLGVQTARGNQRNGGRAPG